MEESRQLVFTDHSFTLIHLATVADPGIFQKQGALSRRVLFFGSEIVQHLLYVFVVRIEDKLDVANTAC